MPFVSEAQRRWGNSPSGEKALGKAGVKEWNDATPKGKLPDRLKPKAKPSFKQKMRKAFPNR